MQSFQNNNINSTKTMVTRTHEIRRNLFSSHSKQCKSITTTQKTVEIFVQFSLEKKFRGLLKFEKMSGKVLQ